MFAGGHGLGGDDGMGVICGRDHHRVRLVQHFIEHYPVVVVLLRLGVLLKYMVSVLPVDVAESDDVLGFHLGQIGRSPASDADS